MGVKRTYEEVKAYIENNTDCELCSTGYAGTFEPLLLRCSCGREFKATWHQISTQGRVRCVDCALKLRSEHRRRSMDEVKKKIASVGYEYVSGEYVNTKSKIVIRCKCGHTKAIAYSNIFYNGFSGLCDACAYPLYHGTNRLTVEDVRELSALRGLELLSDTYTNAKDKLRFRCECGREFETTWDSVSGKNKVRCDHCAQSISSGERAICSWLEEHGIEYEREKSFPGFVGATNRPFKFDFYIPAKNLCIEYDGQQHSKVVDYSGRGDKDELMTVLLDTMFRDYQKTQFCEQNGIDLLRINYTDKEKLPELLANKLIPR